MNHTPLIKQTLRIFKDNLCQEFCRHVDIRLITEQLVTQIDTLLIHLFHKRSLDKDNDFCLLALGSYGRRELQLYSDIDLLILHPEKISTKRLEQARLFIQDCWDIGLEVGHQITTVNACSELASSDLSVISSILDMHLVCGKKSLMEELRYQTQPLHMWSIHEYFFAKQYEQNKRYNKYDQTAYNLEPNVKYGPGGLRDIQVLLNMGKRQFGINKLSEGIHCGFITDKEYDELMHCQYFLWKVRFGLHFITQKKEERLLFDHQIKLAALFGYHDNAHSLAIEQFMKSYFTVIKRSRELNEMLLQWFSEAIVYQQKQKITALDDAFQLSNHYIEIRRPKIFANNPQTLLELFHWIAKSPTIEGVRASTIRLIHEHLYCITPQFCQSKKATQTFMAILRSPNDPYAALQRMNRYGVLAKYLDCFAAVTGQMQYDLFHVYTVDQHTLFVIRNIARFLKPKYQSQFPLCSQVIANIPKREILYLAALFHDIAKGRGGDHSELGAIEAKKFAVRHQLNEDESDLLIWLVKNHLLMSQTAQRQDIYAPKTIQHFCSLLPKREYLDYLYLLTVADICGTNPTLWNAWKDSLLKELYVATQLAFAQETRLLNETSLIHERQKEALTILANDVEPTASATIQDLWNSFNGRYFLHESPAMIARHTKAILSCTQFPLVLIMPHHSQGGTEVFIYMPHREDRFTITTTVLSNYHATIQEAMILTCANHFDMDTYIILDEHNQVFFDKQRIAAIHKALVRSLADQHQLPTLSHRRLSRTQAHFNFKPRITYSQDSQHQYTRLFLVTNDRPGLLASITRIFVRERIHLHNAKIATAGERVEDMFYITNQEGVMLSHAEENALREKVLDALGRESL